MEGLGAMGAGEYTLTDTKKEFPSGFGVSAVKGGDFSAFFEILLLFMSTKPGQGISA